MVDIRVLLSFGCELPVCFSQFLQHNLSDDFWLFVFLGNVCVPSSFELQRHSFSSLKQIALSGAGVVVPGWDNGDETAESSAGRHSLFLLLF